MFATALSDLIMNTLQCLPKHTSDISVVPQLSSKYLYFIFIFWASLITCFQHPDRSEPSLAKDCGIFSTGHQIKCWQGNIGILLHCHRQHLHHHLQHHHQSAGSWGAEHLLLNLYTALGATWICVSFTQTNFRSWQLLVIFPTLLMVNCWFLRSSLVCMSYIFSGAAHWILQ